MNGIEKFDNVILESIKSYSKSSSLKIVKPNQTYLAKAIIKGISGKSYSAYFGVILFNKNQKAIARRIRWLNDFSGNEHNYEIIFKTPNDCVGIKFIYRINNQTPIKSDSHYITTILNKIDLVEVFDVDEDFELAWQFDVPRIKSLNENEKRKNFDINHFERKIFSQNGEDGILEFIFEEIGTTNK